METNNPWMRAAAATSLTLSGVLLLTACQIPTPQGTGGGTASTEKLIVGVPNDVTGRELDPALTAGGTAIPLLYSLYDTLFKFDPSGKPMPNLLSESTASDGGKVRVLTIKDGLTFQDGSVLDATDVKFSLDRARGKDATLEGPTATSSLSSIEDITVTDPRTVTLTLKFDDAVLDNTLAYLPGMILPSDYLEKVGNNEFLKAPVGSGPYAFESAKSGQEINLKAFENFQGTSKPQYKSVQLKVLSEAATRVAQLRAGGVDFAVDMDTTQIQSLESAGLKVQKNPSGQFLSIIFNSKSTALADPRVRQALNMATDRKGIVETLFHGNAAQTGSLDPTSGESVKPMEQDAAKARALLQEAGWDSTKELTLDFPSGRYPQDAQMMQSVQADLDAVGVKVKLRPMDSSDWLNGLRNKTLDDMSLTLNANINYDPYLSLTGNTTCKGSFSLWCDPLLDAKFAEVQPLSGEARKAKFVEISEQFQESPPALFLIDPYQMHAMAKTVQWNPTTGIRNYSYADIVPAS